MKNCFNICLLIVFTKLAIAQELPIAEIEKAKQEASLAVSEGICKGIGFLCGIS